MQNPKFIILFLALAAAFCGCVEHDVSMVEFTLDVKASPETKGYVTGTTLVDDNGDQRFLYLSAWMRGSNGRQDNYFTNEPFFDDQDKWRHDPPIYVPFASSFDILGYCSSVAIPATDVQWGFPNNAERMRISFDAGHLQDDILYGAAYGNMSTAGGPVTMTMYHAQAWIDVYLHRKAGATGSPVTVTGVTLERLFTGCEVTVDANGGEPLAYCRTRRFVGGDFVMADPSGIYSQPLTEQGGTLKILVPEQDQTTLRIDYAVSDAHLSSTIELPHTHWVMGVHYRYEIEFDPLDEVFFLATYAVMPWTVGTNYTENI